MKASGFAPQNSGMPQILTRAPRAMALVAALALAAVTHVDAFATPADTSAETVQPTPDSVAEFGGMALDLHRGIVASDERIRSLKLEGLEPLALALMGFHREMNRLGFAYQEKRQTLSLSKLLAPATISNEAGRADSRVKVGRAAQALDQYVTDADAALTRSEAALASAFARTPARYGIPSSFTTMPTQRLRAHIAQFVPMEKQRQAAVVAVLDLLDQHPDSFRLSTEEKPALEFFDSAVHMAYRVQAKKLNDLNDRIDELNHAPAAQNEAAVSTLKEQVRELESSK